MDVRRLKGEIVREYGTQSAFAKAIGWHENKVSLMMNHKYTPDVEEAAAIANLLHLSEACYIDIFLPRKSPNGDKMPQPGTDKRG